MLGYALFTLYIPLKTWSHWNIYYIKKQVIYTYFMLIAFKTIKSLNSTITNNLFKNIGEFNIHYKTKYLQNHVSLPLHVFEPYFSLERVLPNFLLWQVGCRHHVVMGRVVLERVVVMRCLHQPVTIVMFTVFHTEAVRLEIKKKERVIEKFWLCRLLPTT